MPTKIELKELKIPKGYWATPEARSLNPIQGFLGFFGSAVLVAGLVLNPKRPLPELLAIVGALGFFLVLGYALMFLVPFKITLYEEFIELSCLLKKYTFSATRISQVKPLSNVVRGHVIGYIKIEPNHYFLIPKNQAGYQIFEDLKKFRDFYKINKRE